MNEITIGPSGVEGMIFEVRGKQVMLDSDLARLFEVMTGNLNKAMKRNAQRFPEDFCFQLTNIEYENLKCQIGISNLEDNPLIFQNGISNGGRGGRRILPYVYTEQGVAMLSSVIHSEVAIKMSVKIINAFVAMRKYIGGDLLEQKYINNQVMKNAEAISKNTAEIKLLQDSFAKFEEKKMTSEIYFNGQIYDAYSKICEIFSEAKEQIMVIDSYADKTILDIIRRLKVKVVLITRKGDLLTRQDIAKYNKQYHNLSVIYNSTFHDRYFILDGVEVYHCGASVNRIGMRTFSITRISDEFVKRSLLERCNSLA